MKSQLGIHAELERGSGGIFTVEVDGRVVARKTVDGFPTEDQVVAAVRAASVP